MVLCQCEYGTYMEREIAFAGVLVWRRFEKFQATIELNRAMTEVIA